MQFGQKRIQKMESKTQNKEPMGQMNQGMSQMPINNIPNYPYFIPDYNQIPNYPQMALYANRQQMNGYQYQIEPTREEQPKKLNPILIY